MKFVLSLGGSVLGFSEGFEKIAENLQKFADVLEKLSEEHTIFVVVGGGKIARDYIQVGREVGADETYCDLIGIAVTRLNAMLLASAIKSAPRRIPVDFIEAAELGKMYSIVVMGGTFPGHTTDATAALLAEFVSADVFLNATSVDGVYTDDPRTNREARKIPRMSPSELVELISRTEMGAGANVVIDLLAAKVIERSKIRTVIFLGKPENIVRVVRNENVEEIGTVIE
jgi:uridylate kinase